MRLKRLTVFVLAVFLMAGFTACDSNNVKKVETGSKKTKNSLKIYYMDYDYKIQNALGIFKDKYKDVNIEDTIFSNEDEYKNKVTMDTLTGEGPDVLIFRPRWFESVNKLSANGALCDINEFIIKDKDFKMSDYNEKVLNSFEKDGKRLMIPLDYYTKILMTSREALEKNNIKIDLSNWTLPKLVEIVKGFSERNKGRNKYFFDSRFNISYLIDNSGISFIDYPNKKSRYNSDDFIKILQSYKEIHPSILRRGKEEDISEGEDLKKGMYVMMADYKVSPSFIWQDSHMYKEVGQEIEIYPFPALNNSTSNYAAFTEFAVGMNSQSRNKETAYQFIKLLMSKELQKTYEGKNIIPGIPINKAAYKEDVEHYSKSRLDFIPLSKKIKEQLDIIASTAEKSQIKEVEIDKIVEEALPDFLDGRKTAAQTAKEIDDKVNLYLNE